MGCVAQLHFDKWLTYLAGLEEVRELGLADQDHFADWILIEATTAAEFMAALALSLCETVGREWQSSDQNRSESWVPTTDKPPAIRALLTGLEPVSGTFSDAARLHARVRGELQVAEVRTHLMERLLPVPHTTVPVEKIVEFRRKHGNLLPKFRRDFESKIDESLMIPDPVLRSRFMDRIEDEMLERSEEGETYLQELGLRHIGRSSLLRVLKLVPGLKNPIETTQDLAKNLQTSQDLETEPLAYLAFARAIFAPVQNYRVDPSTGMPLIEAMQ
jgi:hypothetical protein